MSPESGACEGCLRRSRALSLLSVRIDHSARDLQKLQALLSLTEDELIDALGGRRREELRELCATPLAQRREGATSCPHAAGAPAALASIEWRPCALSIAGDRQRLTAALNEPIVTILGTKRPSDYGVEVSRALGRGLSAAGVTIAAPLQEGIPAAALAGALSIRRAGALTVQHGVALAVLPGGLDVRTPSCLRWLRSRLSQDGCAISQLPDDAPPRRWGLRAAQALTASIASLIVVVEAREEQELAAARLAAAGGVPLSAVPGRLTSPAAAGPHSLLRDGASLITQPKDVLELLYRSEEAPLRGHRRHLLHATTDCSVRQPPLNAIQKQVLHRVGDGQSTLDALLSGPHPDRTLIALSELEAKGLLARDHAGRYLRRLAQAHQVRLS